LLNGPLQPFNASGLGTESFFVFGVSQGQLYLKQMNEFNFDRIISFVTLIFVGEILKKRF
jgi:hypothetical protein